MTDLFERTIRCRNRKFSLRRWRNTKGLQYSLFRLTDGVPVFTPINAAIFALLIDAPGFVIADVFDARKKEHLSNRDCLAQLQELFDWEDIDNEST